GVIYERAHTRQISAFGGMATRMPRWAFYFLVFMFGSIGLPGLSGFVGEFLVALATWDYNPWAAFFTCSVVIAAALYLLWLYQRVVFGRAWGESPDPLDKMLTRSEEQELAASGGHGDAGIHPVSGGDHDAHDPAAGEGYPTHEGQLNSLSWKDLS